jgi:hypothetical protein
MARSPHLSRTVRAGIGTVIVDDLALTDVLRGGYAQIGQRRLPGLRRAVPSAPLDEPYSIVSTDGRRSASTLRHCHEPRPVESPIWERSHVVRPARELADTRGETMLG